MSIPPNIAEQAEQIVARYFGRSGVRRVNVFGSVGMGKTTLLEGLATCLRSAGRIPILVAPAVGEIDTGCDAVLQIAEGLANHGLLKDATRGEIADPGRTFGDKVDRLAGITEGHRDSLVFLCDEPREWAIRSKSDQLFYVGDNTNTRLFAERLVDEFKCSKIVAERGWDQQTDYPYHYMVSSEAIATDSIQAEFCDELDSILHATPSLRGKKSFLYLRLLAALAASGASSTEQPPETDSGLANHFVRYLMDQKLTGGLLKLAAKLALVRGDIDQTLLAELGFDDQSLATLEQRLIKNAFLCETQTGDFRMHPQVRQAVERAAILTPEESLEAHALIAEFQAKQLVALREANRVALLTEYRGYDHSAKAGFASIERFSHYFVSQLHVWGRCLSRDMKQHEKAAEVFRLAIQEDPRDDYGHHYLAYNLDYVAADESASEEHYRKAVEYNFRHPWYWSRWINFLITTGRMADARNEWSIAGNVVSVPNCDDETYLNLHFWVAQLLLHRAQLDFAQQVLDEVPESIRRTEVMFVELEQLLESLKIARDERSVFPAYIDPRDYWSEYPHLRQPLQWKQRGLTQFAPARVEAATSDLVVLVAGKQEHGEPRYGRLELSRKKFDESSVGFITDALSAGRFLELCFYGDDRLLRIDAYPLERPDGSMLPPLDPPNPNRYLEGWNPRT